MPDERQIAQEWIGHHLDAASSTAEEAKEQGAQELIDELIRALRELWSRPAPS